MGLEWIRGRKGLASISLFLLMLALAFPAAYCDITTNNRYYVNGDEIQEKVLLHNVDYINEISIYPIDIIGISKSQPSPDAKDARLEDTISVKSRDGNWGNGAVGINAGGIKLDRSFITGSSDVAEISYRASNGRIVETSSIQGSRQWGYLESKNNFYIGLLTIAPGAFISRGTGESVPNADGSFQHNIRVILEREITDPWEYSNNKWAYIDSDLTFELDSEPPVPEIPALYKWSTFATGSPGSVAAGITIDMWDGNGDLDAAIQGFTNIGISDKNVFQTLAPLANPMVRQTRSIYTRYRIT